MASRKFSADRYVQWTAGVPEQTFAHNDSVEEYIDSLVDEYDMHEDSIRAQLLSRVLIVQQHKTGPFRIAVSGNMDAESENPLNKDATAIHVLAEVHLEHKAMYRALRICSDIRTAYLRHNPGRCLNQTGESSFDTFKPSTAYVYIAFFDED